MAPDHCAHWITLLSFHCTGTDFALQRLVQVILDSESHGTKGARRNMSSAS
jgi:hypothetical protein